MRVLFIKEVEAVTCAGPTVEDALWQAVTQTDNAQRGIKYVIVESDVTTPRLINLEHCRVTLK
jgi:hypothetical protein